MLNVSGQCYSLALMLNCKFCSYAIKDGFCKSSRFLEQLVNDHYHFIKVLEEIPSMVLTLLTVSTSSSRTIKQKVRPVVIFTAHQF